MNPNRIRPCSRFDSTVGMAVAVVLCAPICLLAADAGTVRFATFNASLNRNQAGQLITHLGESNRQAKQVAAIIQHIAPDVLLINEFDYDAEGKAVQLFVDRFLRQGQFGEEPIEYPFRFHAAVNTGVPSGVDLNGDGQVQGPQDAFGFGRFPGQYGMLVLSKFPINKPQVRTFQSFLWKDLHAAELPKKANGDSYYSEAAIDIFRLSSKSHWDVPIDVSGRTIHLLASHPTPPVFDGDEDRNGLRNQAEICFWSDYISAQQRRTSTICDDQRRRGGIANDASFVIAGDLNSDPHDGDSRHGAIAALLKNSRVNGSVTPSSAGAVLASQSQGKVNEQHRGNPSHDTADFYDGGSGNIRVDYVLPSSDLEIVDSGVFWPAPDETGADWIKCSDHRLVWIDVKGRRIKDEG